MSDEGGYVDNQSVSGQPMDGPGKNFKDLLIFKYYEQKGYVDREWALVQKKENYLTLLESLLDYVPDKERHDELYNFVDQISDTNEDNLVRKRKKELANPDYSVKDLDNNDRLDCYSRACKQVKYLVQTEINSAHGLVKERAIGITFPYTSKGRFVFPISLVPPDGTYVKKDTGREYDFKLLSVIMRRTGKKELVLDDQEEDFNGPEPDGGVSPFELPPKTRTPKDKAPCFYYNDEYINERVAATMTWPEIDAGMKSLTREFKFDRDAYDDMGWPRANRIYPIDHEELNRVRRMEDDTGFMDVARFFAEVVTGESNMNVLLLGVGASGSGKSYGLTHLLWGVAVWVADIKDHDPANWRKYYPYWTNTRVIDKESFTDLFKDLGYTTIKLGDDAFNALNRTEFQTDFIKELNTIAATDRIFRGVSAFSCQWAGMIDKVIRDLASYRLDFKQDKNARKWSELNRMKFHLLDFNHYDKRNPIYTRYFHTRRRDVEDHYAGTACEELAEWYDIYRILGAVALKKRPKDEGDSKSLKFKCTNCGGGDIRTGSDKIRHCRKCGHSWPAEELQGEAQPGMAHQPKRRGKDKTKARAKKVLSSNIQVLPMSSE